MRFNPYPYQSRAIDFIADHPRCALFLDMGLGKTAVTLTAIARALWDDLTVSHALVVAPKSTAVNTWPSEVAKWDGFRDMTLEVAVGTVKHRQAVVDSPCDVTVINRENVPWLVNYAGEAWPYDMVVLDESSSFKNHQSARWKALKKMLPKITRLVLLTGTPSPNGLEDLWAQIYLLDGGKRLGHTLTSFRNRWFYPGARNGDVVYQWIPRRGADKEISVALSDVCMSMKAADYISVPAISDIDVPVVLDPKALAAYNRFQRELLLSVADGQEIMATTAAALVNKLLQYTGGHVYDEDGVAHATTSAKLETLKELLEAADSPVLVFYGFKSEIPSLQSLPGAELFDGSPDMLARWNDGGIPVLLAHPASMAYGLNMQRGGSIMVWYSLTWNLELYEQAKARLHRQGQTRPVRNYRLVCPGTVDERVAASLGKKSKVQDLLMSMIK